MNIVGNHIYSKGQYIKILFCSDVGLTKQADMVKICQVIQVHIPENDRWVL